MTIDTKFGANDVGSLLDEIKRLSAWVADLQSGMYINCVYCGHRYGPADNVPVSMADVLKAHVEQCPKHPMSHLRAELAKVRKALGAALNTWCPFDPGGDGADGDTYRLAHEALGKSAP